MVTVKGPRGPLYQSFHSARQAKAALNDKRVSEPAGEYRVFASNGVLIERFHLTKATHQAFRY